MPEKITDQATKKKTGKNWRTKKMRNNSQNKNGQATKIKKNLAKNWQRKISQLKKQAKLKLKKNGKKLASQISQLPQVPKIIAICVMLKERLKRGYMSIRMGKKVSH